MARIETKNAAAVRRTLQSLQVGSTASTPEDEMTFVVLRPKRQLTLPKAVCEHLGITPGDRLELTVDGQKLVARSSKAMALEALREIHEAFKLSGLTEEEMLEEARRVRKEVFKARYGGKL